MSTTPGSDRRALVGAVILIPLVIALALAAFAWPAARLAPRDLPVGVAGPGATQVSQRLAEHEGAFDVHRYDDELAARAAIEDREVYGAIVAGPDGVTVLTASAASPLVAQLLQQPFAAQGAKVVDVVPTDADDPRGAAFGSSVLPLVLAGVALGVALSLLSRPGIQQVMALVVAASITGLVGVGITQAWLGVLGGNWLVNAGVLALTVFSIAATIAGLAALLGRPGIPLGALLMVLVGNPFSGAASAPELLPETAAMIGQLLPPGAGATLLRGTAFFGGAGATRPLAVLIGWAVFGLLALTVGAMRSSRATQPVSPAAPVPA